MEYGNVGAERHANALGTRGSALALEGKTVARRVIIHHSAFIIHHSYFLQAGYGVSPSETTPYSLLTTLCLSTP